MAQKKSTLEAAGQKAVALRIRSVSQQGFRRLGISFTQEGETFALDRFSEAEIDVLRNEPMLTITGCEIDAPEAPAPEGEQK
jgi:hypothetical protein